MPHVCSWKIVKRFDNAFRPLFHNPRKIFAPYIKPGMRVMDVGCGAGWASIGMAHMVGENGKVVSVDLQMEMLNFVKERAEKAGLAARIHLHQCKENSLNVEGLFDFVNAFYMVHEVPDKPGFLKEVYSVQNPGGKLFIAEPSFHVTKRDFQKVIDDAQEIGFRVHAKPRIFFSISVVLSKD